MKGMQIMLEDGIVATILDYKPALDAKFTGSPDSWAPGEPSEINAEFRYAETGEAVVVEDDSPLWDTVREICDEEYTNAEYAQQIRESADPDDEEVP